MSFQTLERSIISTVYHLDKSPGAETFGGVTLLIEPSPMSPVTWNCLDMLRCPFIEDIFEGLQAYCDHWVPQLRGVKVCVCAWLDHPIDARGRAFRVSAAYALHRGLTSAGLKDWSPESFAAFGLERDFASSSHPHPTNDVSERFKEFHDRINQSANIGLQLQVPKHLETGLLRIPILAHVTLSNRFFCLAPDSELANGSELADRLADFPFIFSHWRTQVTVTLQPIASIAKPCVLDKRTAYYPQDQPILETLTETIRAELAKMRGFEVLVHDCDHRYAPRANTVIQSSQQRQKREYYRQTRCLAALKLALQQALYV